MRGGAGQYISVHSVFISINICLAFLLVHHSGLFILKVACQAKTRVGTAGLNDVKVQGHFLVTWFLSPLNPLMFPLLAFLDRGVTQVRTSFLRNHTAIRKV